MTSEELALVPVEQPPPIEVTRNELFPLKKDGIENVPVGGSKPYYIAAKDGLFFYNRTLLGWSITKCTKMPSHLKTLGESKGYFTWDGPKIPAEICAKAVSFFRRIYETKKTEAEVLLLLNYKTLEWDILVPKQETSHGHVKSEIEHSDVPKGFLIAGTMHSHCNFSAFHSGTDVADAAEMDGIHVTVGHVDTDNPDIAVMVSMSGSNFTFLEDEVTDFSNLDAAKAPEEWDEKVTPSRELIEKKKKPDNDNSKLIPYRSNYAYGWDEFSDYGGWERAIWGDDDWWKSRNHEQPKNVTNSWESKWDNGLDDKIVDKLLTSTCLTDEDLIEASKEDRNIVWWRTLYMQKMSDVAVVLNTLGMSVDYKISPKRITKEELEERLKEEGFEVVEISETEEDVTVAKIKDKETTSVN